jgi:hypothetical protein
MVQATFLAPRQSEYDALTSSRRREWAELARSLRREMGGEAGEWKAIVELRWKDWIPDNTHKFLGLDGAGRARFVAIVSPVADPRAVAGAVVKAEEARRVLGPQGRVVLGPIRAGALDGLDYAVFPYCRPLRLRRRILRAAHRTALGKRILPWLRAATETTAGEASESERRDRFAAPLARILDESSMPARVRRAAEEAAGRLEAGAWRPRVSIMHDDLNLQNVLRPPGMWAAWRRDMVVIDWERSSMRGHPFYDLVGMTMWMKPGRRRLRAELDAHRAILGCDPVDVRGYMVAALGCKYAGLDGPLPERVASRPGDVVLDDVLRTIGGDRRKLMVEVAAAIERFDQLVNLEAYLDARH